MLDDDATIWWHEAEFALYLKHARKKADEWYYSTNDSAMKD